MCGLGIGVGNRSPGERGEPLGMLQGRHKLGVFDHFITLREGVPQSTPCFASYMGHMATGLLIM